MSMAIYTGHKMISKNKKTSKESFYYEIFNILSINSDTDLTQPSAYCFTVAGE